MDFRYIEKWTQNIGGKVWSYLLDITILNKVRNNKGFNNMSLHSLFRELRKCKQDIIQLDETKTISKITQITETHTKELSKNKFPI